MDFGIYGEMLKIGFENFKKSIGERREFRRGLKSELNNKDINEALLDLFYNYELRFCVFASEESLEFARVEYNNNYHGYTGLILRDREFLLVERTLEERRNSSGMFRAPKPEFKSKEYRLNVNKEGIVVYSRPTNSYLEHPEKIACKEIANAGLTGKGIINSLDEEVNRIIPNK